VTYRSADEVRKIVNFEDPNIQVKIFSDNKNVGIHKRICMGKGAGLAFFHTNPIEYEYIK